MGCYLPNSGLAGGPSEEQRCSPPGPPDRLTATLTPSSAALNHPRADPQKRKATPPPLKGGPNAQLPAPKLNVRPSVNALGPQIAPP